MRKLFAILLSALVASYAAVAAKLFVQNRWAEELPAVSSPGELRHPEAILALAQFRFAHNRFRDEELELVKRALHEAPSFYESSYLLATFHASRFDPPSKVRAAFDAALSGYPSNGRLHLAYGTWLLESRQSLEGWRSAAEPSEVRDPLSDAEHHLKTAMALEPDLSGRALAALRKNRVPTDRWSALVPDTPLARTSLLDALFQSGEIETVWESLDSGALPSDDPNILSRVVYWGLSGGRPEIALRAALDWQAHVERSQGAGPDLFKPALYVVRSHLAMDDPVAAYDSLTATLELVESRSRGSSRSSLEFLCATGDEFFGRDLSATAELLYEQAASRNPSYVPALIGLARSFARSGDDEGAARHYERALRVEPSNEIAERELERLRSKRNRS